MKTGKSKSSGVGIGAAMTSVLLVIVAKLGCCGLPVLAALLGALGISSTWRSMLEPDRPLFIGVAICGVGYSFFKVYGPRRKGCGCSCGPSRFAKVSVWVCALLVVGMLLHLALTKHTKAAEERTSCGCNCAPSKQ